MAFLAMPGLGHGRPLSEKNNRSDIAVITRSLGDLDDVVAQLCSDHGLHQHVPLRVQSIPFVTGFYHNVLVDTAVQQYIRSGEQVEKYQASPRLLPRTLGDRQSSIVPEDCFSVSMCNSLLTRHSGAWLVLLHASQTCPVVHWHTNKVSADATVATRRAWKYDMHTAFR